MPNALVEHYRQQYPNGTLSDAEITLGYIDRHGLEAMSQYPGVADDYKRIELAIRKGTAPGYIGELKKSIASGVDMTQAKLYDTAALAGDLVGSKTLTDWGQAGYDRNLQEAAQNSPTIQDPREIEGLGDAARYTFGLIGSQAPQMGLTIGGGLAGRAVGGAAGAALGGMVAGPLGAVPGAAIGAFAGSLLGAGGAGFSQMQNRGELRSTPGVDQSKVIPTAIGVGAIGGALEELPILRLFGKAFKPATKFLPDLIPTKLLSPITRHLADDEFGLYLGRVLKNVPEQAVLEGSTEVLQELTTMAGEEYANRNNPHFKITPEQVYARLLQNGLAGALLGGGAGAIESIPNHAVPPPVDALAPSTEQPAPAQTPRAPVALVPNPVASNLGAGAPPPPPGDEVSPIVPVPPNTRPSVTLNPEEDSALAAAFERGQLAKNTAAKVAEAAAQTDTNPSEAQKEAGNYRKGKVTIHGLDISIENPVGSVRRGVDANGEPWQVTLPANYGYVKGTKASDGDHVDVYLGPNPALPNVYVVDQINPETEKFDEIKTMMGFPDKASAITAYDAAFSDGRGPERRAGVTETTVDQFKDWLEKGDRKKPFSESKQAQPSKETANPTTNPKPIVNDLDVSDAAYNAVQTQIDAFEDSLASQGINVAHLYDPENKALEGHQDWKPMPPELVALYKKREQIGAAQMNQSVSDLKHRLSKIGLNEGEANQVLDYYGIDPTRRGAIAQTLATEHAPKLVDQRPETQAEGLAIALSAERNELTDEVKDISRKSLTDAAKAVMVVREYFGHSPTSTQENVNAENGKITGNNQVQYPNGNVGGPSPESRSSDSTQKGGQVPKAVDPKDVEALQAVIARERQRLEGGERRKNQALLKDKAILESVINLERQRLVKDSETKNKGFLKDQEILRDVIDQERQKIEARKSVEELLTQQPAADQATPPAQTVNLDLNAVDWDGSHLSATETEHGTGGEERVSEKPFFKETATEYSKELAERLTSDAAAHQGNKSDTTRYAFFERPDGTIEGYPIYKKTDNSRGGTRYYVAGTQLEKFMKDGSAPVASFRLAQPVSAVGDANVIRYADYKTFERELLNPAIEREQAETGRANAVEANMQAQGFDDDGNVVERQAEPGATTTNEEDPLRVFQDAFVEEVGGIDGLRDLTLDETRAAVSEVAKHEPVAFMAVAKEVLKNESVRNDLWSKDPKQAKTLLTEAIAEAVHDKIQEVLNSTTHGQAARPSLEGGGLLFSTPIPAAERATKSEVGSRFNQLAATFRDLGLEIDVTKALGKEVGTYSGKERKITLALFDAENPSRDNLRLLLHEFAHDVSNGLPDDIRAAIHAAIESYSDEKLGITGTLDPRISKSNPSGLSQPVLNEERLAEHLAQRGLDRPTASSLASQLVRAIKEFYFKMAMGLQKILGRTPSQRLAMSYVQNRFDALTAGDRKGLLQFLIPPGKIQSYPDTLFSLPGGLEKIGDRVDNRVNVERRIAALNERLEVDDRIAKELEKVPAAVASAAEEGMPILDWWRMVSRSGNPKVLVNAEQQKVDPTTGLTINPDPDARISKFASKDQQALAAIDALSEINKTYNSVQKRLEAVKQDVKDFEDSRKKAAEKLERLSEEPRLPMADKDAAKRKKRMGQLAREAKSSEKKANEAQAKVTAIENVIGQYLIKRNELAGIVGAHNEFHFGHGAELLIPKTANATPADFETLKVQYDSHGQLTKKSEIDAALEKMTEWLEAPGREKDGLYHQIRVMKEEIAKNQIGSSARQTSHMISGMASGSMSEQAKGIGTPLAMRLGAMINKWVSTEDHLKALAVPIGDRVSRYKHEAANILKESVEWYEHHIYGPIVDELKNRADIAETLAESPKKQVDTVLEIMRKKFLANTTIAPKLAGKDLQFMGAVRKHIDSELEGFGLVTDKSREGGAYVRDARIGMSRPHVNLGVATIPERASPLLDSVFTRMKDANWAAAEEEFAQFDGSSEKAEEIDKFFANPEIWNNFVQALVERSVYSPFFGLQLEDGTTPEANPAFVREAFDKSGGSVMQFLTHLYELQGGKLSDTEAYTEFVKQNLGVFAEKFNEVRGYMEQSDPQGMGEKNLRNMIPGFAINAIKSLSWPATWKQAVSFDQQAVQRIVQRVAAQIAFGAGNERFAQTYEAAVEEMTKDLDKLKQAEARVEQRGGTDKNALRAALEKEVGGKAELARLRRVREQKSFLTGSDSIEKQLIKLLGDKGRRPLSFVRTLTKLFGGLMVNNPGSALGQLADVFASFLPMGASPQAIRHSVRTAGGVTRSLAGGLINSFGHVLQREDRWHQRAMEVGANDYEATRRAKDMIFRQTPVLKQTEGALKKLGGFATEVVHKARALQNASVGAWGLRPLAPFSWINQVLHTEGTVNFWKEVDDMVAQGVKWAKNHPTEVKSSLADDPMATWASRIGKSGRSKDAFVNIFQRASDEHGLDYFQLVKEGIRNEKAGKELLSNETLQRLQGMWVKEITSRSNASTMSSSAFNNHLLEAMIPLLGWGWMRSRKVAGLRMDAHDKASMTAFTKGMMGLAVLGGGGLAVSALVDLYNDELQRKKRNLRRLSPDQDGANLAMAILEHSARVGTFGILGDLANEAVNVGTGSGANRGISADNRIVFLNSLMGMIRATSAFANQDFEADYMNVIRPLMFSMGGNGALQYLQVANTLFDLDNQESRAVRRTNVGNWLRVIGREQGLEVNTDQRGYSSPTPITPFITRMQLAALADNREDFMAARMDAIAKAREEGKANAAEYVARTYSSRNPLRSVFRTPPTEQQYRQLLNAMPDDGREDVMTAINLFNRYGASMGVMPFDGKAEKHSSASSYTMDTTRNARDRAAMFY